jgi:hypothetical protein
VAAGTPAATGSHPRQLIEAASGGQLSSALTRVPHGAREVVASAAHQGFLAGLNTVLVGGGAVALVGALVAAWLVRERDIERELIPSAPVVAEAVR